MSVTITKDDLPSFAVRSDAEASSTAHGTDGEDAARWRSFMRLFQHGWLSLNANDFFAPACADSVDVMRTADLLGLMEAHDEQGYEAVARYMEQAEGLTRYTPPSRAR